MAAPPTSPGRAKRARTQVRTRGSDRFTGPSSARSRLSERAAASPREEARDAFRKAILAAAERVFERSGFYAARMADIAKEAGVGVGTLYNYFDNKDVILAEILDALHEEFMAALQSSAKDPLDRLREIMAGAFRSLEDHGALLSIFRERGAVGECDVERLVGTKVSGRYDEFLSLLEDAVRDAVRAKKLRSDVEPALIAAAFSGTMNGAVYAWLKRNRRGRLSDVTEDLFRLFLRGARWQ